jgi:prevent-host-death family protein
MKTFTYSDMNRTPGEILDIALVEPVMLTKRGKGKLVVMSAVDFDILKHGRAFTVENMPDSLVDLILESLPVNPDQW